MFKLVVLSALLAVAAARPGVYESSPLVYSAPIVREQGFARIGGIYRSLPTAVSHQSSTIVHRSTPIVQPIVAPIVRTYAATAPIIKTIRTPLVKTYVAAPLRIAPARISYAAVAPIAYSSPKLTYAAGW